MQLYAFCIWLSTMDMHSMTSESHLDLDLRERLISLGGGLVRYRGLEDETYEDINGNRRKVAKGKHHAERVSKKGMQATDQTRALMRLAIIAAREGCINDAAVAERLTNETGLVIRAQSLWNWKQRYPRFARSYSAAQAEGVDRLEQVGVERAKDPNRKDAFNFWAKVLEAKKPEYRRQVDIKSTHEHQHYHHAVIAKMTDDEIMESLVRHLGRNYVDLLRRVGPGTPTALPSPAGEHPPGSGRVLAPGRAEAEAIQSELLAVDDGAGEHGRRDPQTSPPLP